VSKNKEKKGQRQNRRPTE